SCNGGKFFHDPVAMHVSRSHRAMQGKRKVDIAGMVPAIHGENVMNNKQNQRQEGNNQNQNQNQRQEGGNQNQEQRTEGRGNQERQEGRGNQEQRQDGSQNRR